MNMICAVLYSRGFCYALPEVMFYFLIQRGLIRVCSRRVVGNLNETIVVGSFFLALFDATSYLATYAIDIIVMGE